MIYLILGQIFVFLKQKKNTILYHLDFLSDYVIRLEKEIDQMNLSIEPIKIVCSSWGSKVSSQLHLCRTTCRRAERYVVELTEKEKVNPEILKYLNRLSDWFFVSARKFNNNGKNDILWIPSKKKLENVRQKLIFY